MTDTNPDTSTAAATGKIEEAISLADLFDLAGAMPEHIEHALRASRSLERLPEKSRVENVVVLGMGGSGIAGDVLAAAASGFVPVPITVVKGYEIPAFVGEGSLVFAISFSGNSEEVIEAASEAAVQGARIVVIAGGGRLVELAGSWGSPVVRIPKSIASCDFALGALAIPPIAILEDIGLFPGATQWIELAVEQLKRRRNELAQPGSLAEKLAERLAGKLIVIHGGGVVGAAAALRWKQQINQVAKRPAFWSVQPELSHDELEGWKAGEHWIQKHVGVVALRHDDEHPQVVRRFESVCNEMQNEVAYVESVRAEGDDDLAQLFDLIMIGDFVALHLASRDQSKQNEKARLNVNEGDGCKGGCSSAGS